MLSSPDSVCCFLQAEVCEGWMWLPVHFLFDPTVKHPTWIMHYQYKRDRNIVLDKVVGWLKIRTCWKCSSALLSWVRVRNTQRSFHFQVHILWALWPKNYYSPIIITLIPFCCDGIGLYTVKWFEHKRIFIIFSGTISKPTFELVRTLQSVA